MKLFAIFGLLLFVGVGLALGANYSSNNAISGASGACGCVTCCPDGGCCCESGVCACDDCKCDCCAVGSQSCVSGCCADKEASTTTEQGTCPKCSPKTPTKGPKKLG